MADEYQSNGTPMPQFKPGDKVTMPDMETYILDRVRVTVRQLIPAAEITAHRAIWDGISTNVAKTFTATLLGHHLDVHSVQFPMNWWQAVRERFAPKWWLKKHPVKYQIFEVDVKAIYPNVQVAIPGERVNLVVFKKNRYSD